MTMDSFKRGIVGIRGGRVCPCCGESCCKRVQTRHARKRFRVQTRAEIASVLLDEVTDRAEQEEFEQLQIDLEHLRDLLR